MVFGFAEEDVDLFLPPRADDDDGGGAEPNSKTEKRAKYDSVREDRDESVGYALSEYRAESDSITLKERGERREREETEICECRTCDSAQVEDLTT